MFIFSYLVDSELNVTPLLVAHNAWWPSSKTPRMVRDDGTADGALITGRRHHDNASSEGLSEGVF
jgi:hypothetical protein